jgi:hypothetical protein
MNPIETTEISPAEVDRLRDRARFKVTTVIPFRPAPSSERRDREHPVRNVYLLSQEELDDFLEDYGQYAEFVIGIEEVSEQ